MRWPAQARQHVRPLRGRRIGRHELDGALLDPQSVGLVGGVPQVSRQTIVRHAREQRFGPLIHERNGLTTESGGTLRVTTEECVLGRMLQDLESRHACAIGGVRHLMPDV